MPAGDRADQAADLGTWLWIGNGVRPTVTVVEHMLRWQWPERTEATWESPTLHEYSRQQKLARWAAHLAATAGPHRNGQDGFNVELHSVPLSGKLMCLPPKPKGKPAAK